nr:basic proline-rich protein-like [Aegilops tauschii subsp. strangulata]
METLSILRYQEGAHEEARRNTQAAIEEKNEEERTRRKAMEDGQVPGHPGCPALLPSGARAFGHLPGLSLCALRVPGRWLRGASGARPTGPGCPAPCAGAAPPPGLPGPLPPGARPFPTWALELPPGARAPTPRVPGLASI